MIMTIPGNFKKISFQWEEFPTTSSIMIIHFCFILQKGREKNYIVTFFYSGKNYSHLRWQLFKFSYHKKYSIHNIEKKFLSSSETSRFFVFCMTNLVIIIININDSQLRKISDGSTFCQHKKIAFVGDEKKNSNS